VPAAGEYFPLMPTGSSSAGDAAEDGELSLPRDALIDLMRAVLDKGTTFQFHARGWSMAPFIRDRDVVCVSPLALQEPSVGQVVAFVRAASGQLLVHRVIAAGPDGYRIQGDNTPGMADAAVARQTILGCVTRVTRNGREVRLGLGPERRLIAAFSRAGWLQPACARLASLLSPLRRRKRAV
jgi:hypothetical protein